VAAPPVPLVIRLEAVTGWQYVKDEYPLSEVTARVIAGLDLFCNLCEKCYNSCSGRVK